jgi:predicted deacylase
VEIEVLNRDYYVYAECDGVFEPAVALGANVAVGDRCGDMHSIDDPARSAIPHHFHHDGIVICQRHQGLVQRGDCLAHLATLRKG